MHEPNKLKPASGAVNQYLGIPPSVTGRPVALNARNIYKTYHLGRVKVPVLRGVDLDAAEGEFVAILGASGSGKSTLLHVVGGLDRPDRPERKTPKTAAMNSDESGTPDPQLIRNVQPASVVYRGKDVAAMGRSALNRYRASETGFVFQFYHLLPELTVLQNVTIAAMVRWGFSYAGRAAATRKAAAELLNKVGLSHRLQHKPAELSGGERQRVAIARALINEPTILLADEPTGNLDRTTGETILNMLLAIRAERNLTMLVVTHDVHTAARADRMISLVDGRVAAVPA